MKIYYNKKAGIYIPNDWSVEIKNDKLVYFICGKGCVKTSMKFIEELEVDLKPVNNYTEAWIVYCLNPSVVIRSIWGVTATFSEAMSASTMSQSLRGDQVNLGGKLDDVWTAGSIKTSQPLRGDQVNLGAGFCWPIKNPCLLLSIPPW